MWHFVTASLPLPLPGGSNNIVPFNRPKPDFPKIPLSGNPGGIITPLKWALLPATFVPHPLVSVPARLLGPILTACELGLICDWPNPAPPKGPLADPPFTGGQSPDVRYLITFFVSYVGDVTYSYQKDRDGPVTGAALSNFGKYNGWYGTWQGYGRFTISTPQDQRGSIVVQSSNYNIISAGITRIRRSDGLPDTGGNPPADPLAPPKPPLIFPNSPPPVKPLTFAPPVAPPQPTTPFPQTDPLPPGIHPGPTPDQPLIVPVIPDPQPDPQAPPEPDPQPETPKQPTPPPPPPQPDPDPTPQPDPDIPPDETPDLPPQPEPGPIPVPDETPQPVPPPLPEPIPVPVPTPTPEPGTNPNPDDASPLPEPTPNPGEPTDPFQPPALPPTNPPTPVTPAIPGPITPVTPKPVTPAVPGPITPVTPKPVTPTTPTTPVTPTVPPAIPGLPGIPTIPVKPVVPPAVPGPPGIPTTPGVPQEPTNCDDPCLDAIIDVLNPYLAGPNSGGAGSVLEMEEITLAYGFCEDSPNGLPGTQLPALPSLPLPIPPQLPISCENPCLSELLSFLRSQWPTQQQEDFISKADLELISIPYVECIMAEDNSHKPAVQLVSFLVPKGSVPQAILQKFQESAALAVKGCMSDEIKGEVVSDDCTPDRELTPAEEATLKSLQAKKQGGLKLTPQEQKQLEELSSISNAAKYKYQGFGFKGISSQITSTNAQIEDAKLLMCKLVENQKFECPDPIAAVPEWWQVRKEGKRPQLVILYSEQRQGKTVGGTTWSISIPHYIGNKKPQIPSYRKGNWEGILTLRDNSKIVVNGYTPSEAERVIKALSKYVNKSQLIGSFYKIGQRKGQPLKTVTVAPTSAKFFPTGLQNLSPEWVYKF